MSNLLLCRHHPILIGDTLDYSLYENQYLTTEMLESGNISFDIPAGVTTAYVTSISYRKNKGSWTTTNNSSSAITITVPVVTGDIIEWKGIVPRSTRVAGNPGYTAKFVANEASFNLYGNLLSLFWGDSFIGKTDWPWRVNSGSLGLGAYALFEETNVVDASNLILSVLELYISGSNDCHYYAKLFRNCTSLVYPPAVLPATIIGPYAYWEMFQGCTSLTTMPNMESIQDTTANGRSAYMEMFEGCTALQYNTQQTIHINKATYQGCQSMFQNCTSIVNAPNIEVYELGNPLSGYGTSASFASMFYSCTSLETPPERFDITEVDTQTFYQTFRSCSNLQYAPIVNIRSVIPFNSTTNPTPGKYAFASMFHNCSSLEDGSGLNVYWGDDSEWHGERPFDQTFRNCTSMINGPSLHINGTAIVKSYMTAYYMCYNCTSMETHDIELNYDIDSNATITTGSAYGSEKIFYNCPYMITSPRITRLALRDCEFQRAFDGNIRLKDIYVKFNTNTAGNALTNWLANASGTGSPSMRVVHQAGSLSLPTSVSGVPSNWILDQGDWTAQRHARMSMAFGWYGGTLNDSIINGIIDNPASQDVPTFTYYGDTIEIDDTLYYIWIDDNASNSTYETLLTTTDNFYELRMASLKDGGYNLNSTNLGKSYTWLGGVLSSINEIHYNASQFASGQVCENIWYMFKVYRNQG